jgi:mono/diheme cytochrome c family protein
MKNILPLLIIAVFIVALFISSDKDKATTHISNSPTGQQKHQISKDITKKLEYIQSNQHLKEYIIDVIVNGSKQFNFKGGYMEAGFASKEDAPKIACYVMSLSGKKCQSDNTIDAAMFYSSICAGCHGMDGKGINGTNPDLTRNKLLGILKEEEQILKKLKH